jgi:hypothetical protein
MTPVMANDGAFLASTPKVVESAAGINAADNSLLKKHFFEEAFKPL